MDPTLKALYEERQKVSDELLRQRDKLKDDEYVWSDEDEHRWLQVNKDFNALNGRVNRLEQVEKVERQMAAEKEVAEGDREARERGIARREARYEERPYSPPRKRPTPNSRRENLALRAMIRGIQKTPVGNEERDAFEELGGQVGTDTWSLNLATDYNEFRRRLKYGVEYREIGTPTDTTSMNDVIETEVARRIEIALAERSSLRNAGATVIRTSGGNPLVIPTVDDRGSTIPGDWGGILGESDTDTKDEEISTGALQLDSYVLSTHFARLTKELIEDSVIDVISLVIDLLGDRLARLENYYFTVGSGTAQANGIVTAVGQSGVDIGSAAAGYGALAAPELIDLVHSVNRRHRSDATGFMMNDLAVAAVRKLVDAESLFMWGPPGMQQGQPERLLGYPIFVNERMEDGTAVVQNDTMMLFGDFSKYMIRDVGTVDVVILRELFALEREIGIALIIRNDGELMDAGSGPVQAAYWGAV